MFLDKTFESKENIQQNLKKKHEKKTKKTNKQKNNKKKKKKKNTKKGSEVLSMFMNSNVSGKTTHDSQSQLEQYAIKQWHLPQRTRKYKLHNEESLNSSLIGKSQICWGIIVFNILCCVT